METEIQQIIDNVNEIEIYNNGSTVTLLPAQMGFKLVVNGFKNMLAGARPMPAFGVSLDPDTREAMTSGVWVEFCFNRKLYYSEMPFEKLLLRVVPEYTGFNIVRFNSENGYAGRCYYFDLNCNMGSFYNIVISV